MPNINRLWADLIVEELVRLGATYFAIAPGSRSTPLVTAVAENTRATPALHFDERGSAFHALGHARATGRPAVWLTTSGTAVANGYPAVVEASQDAVPLILLTADRPPELRETGANQTIDQQKLFGDFVRWYFDLPAPDVSVDPRFVLTTVDQAAYRAVASPGGPVQLNCMFREPLAPVEDGRDYRGHLSLVSRWERSGKPYTRYESPQRLPDMDALEDVASAIASVEQGLIVAGRLPASADASPVRALADALNWPLLADVTSQLRHGIVADDVAIPYHAILASKDFREGARPLAVIHLGAPIVSNRMMQYLHGSAPERYVVVQNGPFRADPEHLVTRRFDCDVGAFCRMLSRHVSPAGPRWLGRWRTAARAAAGAVEDVLRERKDLSEPWLASAIPGLMPAGSGLFLGNSMPVRDADTYAFGPNQLRVGANRGASGIDGTLATAAGFCAGADVPMTLVLGDLALLHDLNSLALTRGVRPSFPIVVINNDGGGIFSFLQIAQFDAVFERYFGTPHGLHFEQAAAMFGLPYAAPHSRDAFVREFEAALARTGPTLIEVVTDRSENAALHREIDERVMREVAGAIAV